MSRWAMAIGAVAAIALAIIMIGPGNALDQDPVTTTTIAITSTTSPAYETQSGVTSTVSNVSVAPLVSCIDLVSSGVTDGICVDPEDDQIFEVVDGEFSLVSG